MKAMRYARSRQKACLSCSTAKAKCDRKAGCCTRCALRGLSCTLPQTLPSGGSASEDNEAGMNRNSGLLVPNFPSAPDSLLPNSRHELPAGTDSQNPILELPQSVGDSSSTNVSSTTFMGSHIPKDSRLDATTPLSGGFDFSSQELFCPINVDDIRNRWLNSYVPLPGQKIKEYPAFITAFIYRILKSYAAVAVRGRGVPPFVHASQMIVNSIRPPLSTCLTLARMCEKPLPGSESVAADVIHREMNSLYEQYGTYDDIDHLAAFQAFLIYSMVLFFKLSQVSSPFLRQAMMKLQDLACSSSQRGLMCIAEQQHSRPRWETWIIAEAKRRTLFAMYLFDNVLSAQEGLPTFFGTELQGLPAPAGQLLWRAQSRHEWEMAYNIHLTDWSEEGFHIDELWPSPENLDELGLLERRSRVDQWLEGADEFGTMLYAVTSCTHGV